MIKEKIIILGSNFAAYSFFLQSENLSKFTVLIKIPFVYAKSTSL